MSLLLTTSLFVGSFALQKFLKPEESQHYLVVNKNLVKGYHKDSVSFLVESERGVYTTVRSFETKSIFQYVLHVKRLGNFSHY